MSRKYSILFFLITCTNLCLYSGDYALNGSTWQKDGRSIALGGGMNAIEQAAPEEISINYNLPYNLRELSSKSIKVVYGTKWMNLDALWSQTGDVVFLENYLALGASRNLTESFTLGVKAGYYHYASIIGEKGSTLLSEVLCRYKPYEKMQINIYLFNPTGSKMKDTGDLISLSQSFHLGVSFFTIQKTEWLVEIEKRQLEKPILHLGFEYAAWDMFILRTGLSTPPLRPSWGIGGRINHFKYAVGGNLHPVLGFSSSFSLTYNW